MKAMIRQPCVSVLMLFLAASAPLCADERPALITPIGSFSAIRQDAEHCQGYALDLWGQAGSALGVFRACAGLTGDITGTIASITDFDAASGALTFDAVLSLAMDYHGGREIPSQDHFTFVGRLNGDQIVGTLTLMDEVYPKHKARSEMVNWQRAPAPLPSYPSYEEWRRQAEHPPAAGHGAQ